MPSQHGNQHRKGKNTVRPTGSRKVGRWYKVSAIVVSCAALVMGGAWYEFNQPLKTMIGAKQTKHTHLVDGIADKDRTSVLLIGTDMRPGDTAGNTDVLLVASIDDLHHRIELMSIPRDTQVAYPDGLYRKINYALHDGGPELAINLVQSLLGLPIDNYAITHFTGLVQLIDTIGGVEVNVPKRMYYNTGDRQYGHIRLKPGQQTLSGVQALGFVRYRRDALGDISRTERQQIFLSALMHKLLEPQNIKQLPSIATTVWKSIDTDMSLKDISYLVAHAQKVEQYPVIHETLPGSFHDPEPGDPRDLSYWVVNLKQARYEAKQFFEDGIVTKNPVQDPSITRNWHTPDDVH